MSVETAHIRQGAEILRRYGARRVFVFGRAAETPEAAQDLDLAVEGMAPCDYLKALGDLSDELLVPVDLVDLADGPRFAELIRRRGKVVYERP